MPGLAAMGENTPDDEVLLRAESWPLGSIQMKQKVCDQQKEESYTDEDCAVLFDRCRFHEPASDLLDHVLHREIWEEAETTDGQRLRLVGEVDALKRLFSMPLRSAGETICISRVDDCLVILDTDPEKRNETFRLSSATDTVALSPRACCQVRLEGNMVRVYPSTAPAEPVQVDSSATEETSTSICCEWQVREGVSLLAVAQSSSSGIMELCSASPRSLKEDLWVGPRDIMEFGGLDVVKAKTWEHGEFQSQWPALPEYHKQVMSDRIVVRAVCISDDIETSALVDAWLSCCLTGSPSLLCFFFKPDGICHGCRYVAASDIPWLVQIVQEYRRDRRSLCGAPDSESYTSTTRDPSSQAFDPKALREATKSLLETLLDRCSEDGESQCIIVAETFGLRLFNTTTQHALGRMNNTEDESDDEFYPLTRQAQTAKDVINITSGEDDTHPLIVPDAHVPLEEKLRRAHVSQALLMYHAAVRVAQARLPTATPAGGLKDVPTGSRWTAKSCHNPLRVRMMMLRAVRSLNAAKNIVGSQGDKEIGPEGVQQPPFHWRYLLILASAHEFLADTFLAEDVRGVESREVCRCTSALRHLQRSAHQLVKYEEGASAEDNHNVNEFMQSVKRLEERIRAKRVNTHLSLARLRQRQPWCESYPHLGAFGAAFQELDSAEQLIPQPLNSRPSNAHEFSILASISKWKADLLYELSGIAEKFSTSDAETAPYLKEYLEAQQRDTCESSQPTAQRERWLQSTMSLTLRCLRQLSSVPKEVSEDLEQQARALLASAYRDLGRTYADAGRYTKAMTHAKQGIELFVATKCRKHAVDLQLWLCRLQLRLAVPHASIAGGDGFDDSALLRGLSAVSNVEDSACGQVVLALQQALKGYEDDGDVKDPGVQIEAQTLIGRVLLRQGLSRLASAAPFATVCQLCEGDSTLPAVLTLIRSDFASIEPGPDAVELLLKAGVCFRDAGDAYLNGLVHTCLASVYFLQEDHRMQRLSLKNCEHALGHMRGAADHAHESMFVLQLAAQLLEAKALRRTRTNSRKAKSQNSGDVQAAVVLCNVALDCLRSHGVQVPEVAISYVKKELSDVMFRLLRENERRGGEVRQLKDFYCSVLTAWHAEVGQIDALTGLRNCLQAIATCL